MPMIVVMLIVGLLMGVPLLVSFIAFMAKTGHVIAVLACVGIACLFIYLVTRLLGAIGKIIR